VGVIGVGFQENQLKYSFRKPYRDSGTETLGLPAHLLKQLFPFPESVFPSLETALTRAVYIRAATRLDRFSLRHGSGRRGVQVDLLVNNAGFGLSGAFLSHDRKQKQAEIEVNVQALVALTLHFGEAMAVRGKGGIINVASSASFQPVPYLATYGFRGLAPLHERGTRTSTSNCSLRMPQGTPSAPPTITRFISSRGPN
jgi:short chain dehydrogenase